MVRDLRTNHLSVGMTVAEVRALLGKPDSISGDIPGRWGVMTYRTGPSLMDCFTLAIVFGNNRLERTAEGDT